MTHKRKSKPTESQIIAANHLLDDVMEEYGIKNDAALCRFLGLTPPVVSKMRRGSLGVSGDTKILIHEKTNMSIADIQRIMREEHIA